MPPALFEAASASDPSGLLRSDTISTLELLLAIAVVVVLVVTVARKLGLPYPIVLVVAGLALGVAGFPEIELEPELVLVVLLPPLLFSAAWQTPIRDFRANRRPILLLSVGLVIFTTLVVGFGLNAALPSLPLAAAMTLGAIVAPPDAIAATSILRRLTVPRRIITVLEGESLVNDATALTAFRIGVGATVAGVTATFFLIDAFGQFAYALAGGIAVGLAVGLAISWLWARLFDPPVEILLSLLIPYAAYLAAERVHASGVIATVAAGLLIGRRSSRILSSDTRVLAGSVWQMLTFLFNGFAFLLLGLQLPLILGRLNAYPVEELVGLAVLVCGIVIVARFVWVFPTTYIPRWVSASLRAKDPIPPIGAVTVVAWAGMRGAVSLAAALSLPLDFPDRDLLLFLTFMVILATLVGQGLTLPLLLRRLHLADDGSEEAERLMARQASNEAALRQLERAMTRWPDHRPLIDNLAERFRHRSEHLAEQADPATESDEERLEHLQIMREVLAAQRDAIIGLRDDGAINDEVLREVERELDLEELRLEAEA
ncbi:MAG: Na+/H+ antiporter [Chloroflexota bacterium]